MRSSSGAHFIALDHVRSLAALMVVTWHFTHGRYGAPVPFSYTPAVFVLSLFDEGHTGVALFMTLSGYLFAKLLDGKAINYAAFLWNRILRLLPLLILVIVADGIVKVAAGQNAYQYVKSIASGVVLPTLPNGGWSITVEFHFYLLLPLLLWMLRKSRLALIAVLAAAILLRVILYQAQGSVQFLAYWTLIGRIDQFVLGILLYEFRAYFVRRHSLVLIILVGFSLFYWYFNRQGGYFIGPSYPSVSPLWIFIPTLEGLAYAISIAWYDNSFNHSTSGVSKIIGKIGQLSYSIYLLNFFFVFAAARFVHEHIMDISSFYLAFLWSIVFFILMIPLGYASFYLVESPFLTLRKRYIIIP
jgi:peptidoglycan/LPS O-acetylase OafA/YrhL